MKLLPILTLALAQCPKPPSAYVVRKASGPIDVMVEADEQDWINAIDISDMGTIKDHSPPIQKTLTRLLWDNDNLYVKATIFDDVPWSLDAPRELYKQDVLELFFDPSGSNHKCT